MKTPPLELPQDIEALQALVRRYHGQLSSQSKAYEATIAQLRELHVRAVNGTISEFGLYTAPPVPVSRETLLSCNY